MNEIASATGTTSETPKEPSLVDRNIAKLDSLIDEFGEILAIRDPAKLKTGHTRDEIDALCHNMFIWASVIHKCKDELVGLKKELNDLYVVTSDSMTKEECIRKNVQGNQKNQYIQRIIYEGKGAEVEKAKNRIEMLENVLEISKELLWKYRKDMG